jgi:hypothetical protein
MTGGGAGSSRTCRSRSWVRVPAAPGAHQVRGDVLRIQPRGRSPPPCTAARAACRSRPLSSAGSTTSRLAADFVGCPTARARPRVPPKGRHPRRLARGRIPSSAGVRVRACSSVLLSHVKYMLACLAGSYPRCGARTGCMAGLDRCARRRRGRWRTRSCQELPAGGHEDGRPDRRPAQPGRGADVRQLRPGRVRWRHRRHGDRSRPHAARGPRCLPSMSWLLDNGFATAERRRT